MAKTKYPKGETPWVSYYDRDRNLRFLITSNYKRDLYYLYSCLQDGELKRIGKGKNPKTLETKHCVLESIDGC